MDRRLQRLAWRLKDGWTKYLPPYFVLDFPAAWQTIVQDLVDDRRRIPYRLLNDAIQASLPVVHTNTLFYREGVNTQWILAEEKFDVEKVLAIATAWLRYGIFSSGSTHELAVERAVARMRATPPTWRPFDTALSPGRKWQSPFELVPPLVAREVSQTPLTTVLGTSTRFAPTLYPTNSNVAELMSLDRFNESPQSAVSWVLRLRLETNVSDLPAELILDVSTREWLLNLWNNDKPALRMNRYQIFLRTRRALWEDARPSIAFAALDAKLQSSREDHRTRVWAWDDHIPNADWAAPGNRLLEILNAANVRVSFPTAEQATKLADLKDSPFDARVMWRAECGRKHGTKTGTFPPDKYQMFREITDLAARKLPILEPVEPLTHYTFARSKKPTISATSAFRQTVDSLGTIAVLQSETGDLLKHFMANLREEIGDAADGLAIRQIEIAAYGRLIAHGETRADDVAQRLLQMGIEQPLGAIIELRNYRQDDRYDEKADPKNALRAGFAQAGMVTQFITPANTLSDERASWKHRVKSATLDLLRSMGYLSPVGLQPVANFFTVMGLYTVAGKLPVLTRQHTGQQLEVLFPGLTRWVGYREACLAMARLSTPSARADQDYQVWLVAQLQELTADTLLIVDGQSVRRYWKWLQNEHFGMPRSDGEPDLWIGDPSARLSDRIRSQLAIARLRPGGEAPSWYAEVEGEDTPLVKCGHTSGVFRAESDARWYSLAGRPYSHKEKVHTSREENRRGDAWSPQLVEINAVDFRSDGRLEPAQIVEVVHRLRGANPHWEDQTRLPMLLHLAKQLEEYQGLEVRKPSLAARM